MKQKGEVLHPSLDNGQQAVLLVWLNESNIVIRWGLDSGWRKKIKNDSFRHSYTYVTCSSANVKSEPLRIYEMIFMHRVRYRVCLWLWGLCMCLSVCMMICSPTTHLPAALLPAYTADISNLCSTPSSSTPRTKPRFTQLTIQTCLSFTYISTPIHFFALYHAEKYLKCFIRLI